MLTREFEGGNLDTAEGHGNNEVDGGDHHPEILDVVVMRNDEVVRQEEHQVQYRSAGCRRVACTDNIIYFIYLVINKSKRAQSPLTSQ